MRKQLSWLTGAGKGAGPIGRRKGRAAWVAVITALAPAAVFLASAAGAPAASAGTVPPPPSGWTTAFSDGFTGGAGSGVDSNWTYDQGTQYSGTGCTGNWGTGEVETNTNSTANVSQDGNGHLNITPVDSGGSWTSGRIETVADNFEAPAGGEMEVSASIQQPNPGSGLGYWPVIVNRTDTSDESITWYLNGNAYYTVSESQVGTSTWQAAVDHGFVLILNNAIGGAYPNGVCNCSTPTSSTSSGAAMSVSYVAVYTTSGSGGGGGGGGGGTSCSTTATADISADCDNASQGTIDVTSATGDSNPSGVDGNQAAQLVNGDYLEYNNVNFGSGSSQFDARVASGAAGGVSGQVEVVLDNPANPPVGSFSVGNTGGWTSWQTVPANISTVTGTHNVYLEFVSGAGGDPPFVSLHQAAPGPNPVSPVSGLPASRAAPPVTPRTVRH